MEVDINRIKKKLLVKYPFFGGIVANLNYISNKECITLGTDGESIYYNPEFLETLTEDEQTFLFAHEICHIAFNHIYRSEGKDSKIWNIATDGVINAFLEKDGLKPVKGAVKIPDAINYNAEELYEKLLKENNTKNIPIMINNSNISSKSNFDTRNANTNKVESFNENEENSEKIQKCKNGKGNSTTTSNEKNKSKGIKQERTDKKSEGIKDFARRDYNEIDEQIETDEKDNLKEEGLEQVKNIHSTWEKAIEKKKLEELEKSSNNVEQIEKKKQIDKQEQSDQETIKNDIKKKIDNTKLGQHIKDEVSKISNMEELDAFVKNSKQREENLENLRKELLKKSIGNTNATNSVVRKVAELGEVKPLLDWKYLLRQALNLNADWSYKNATIENGVVTPHLEEQEMPETEILLDTSGSVSEILLRNFLKECKNIFKASKVKVGCFDTKFYGFNSIRTEEDINNMRIVGHGLTNFFSAINAFSRQVENKIIFTDGRGYIPDNTSNIIWIIFGDERINVNSGKVIYIENEKLRELY